MYRIKPISSLLATILFFLGAQAQFVGIGTTSPTAPLTFASNLGNKVVLWGDGTVPHYGMGIQSGQMQLYTDIASSSISLGYGRSGAFNERVRIINAGESSLMVNGRLLLKNGTFPLDLGYGGGIWFYKPDNSTTMGFMGVQNSQNLGFYGGPAGWGFTYDALNSRVGINNNNPNAPLAFAPALGKKITLYPGATGDVGIGVAGNRLQLYADNPNADVALGYDAAGTFNERFAFKPNGAMAVMGSLGANGQVLTSSGGGAVSWQSPMAALYNNTVKKTSTSYVQIINGARDDVPGLSHTFTLGGNAFVLLNYNYFVLALPCTFCGTSTLDTEIYVDGVLASKFISTLDNGQFENITGSTMIPLGAGTHTIRIACKNTGPTVSVGKQFSDVYAEASYVMILQ